MTPDGQQTPNTTADWQTILQALEHKDRRRLLVSLLDHNPREDTFQIPDDIGVEKDRHALSDEMYHHHLPALEAAGYIRWDKETQEVEQGPKFNNIQPVLQLMRDHQDELPPGWL